MAGSAPDVSVVIVSFNTREILATTIAATLADTAGVAAEVVVVDNASSDGSAALVRERFPRVTLITNDRNRYYSTANNQGIEASRGRYVLVLNSDAAPTTGTIPAMLAFMEQHPDVGALSTRLEFPDGRVQRNCARQRTFAQFLFEYTVLGALFRGARRSREAHYRYGDWDRLTERDVEVLPGSCLMVRRDALDRAGVFDERLRLYFGDDDWCLRIRRSGFRTVYAPLGAMTHPESTSVKKVRGLARRLYFEDMIRFVEKHFGRPRAVLLWMLSRPTRWVLDLAGAVRGE